MGDVINLRRARKAKARAGAEEKAATNRVAFGRTKAEKTSAITEREAAKRKLDGHKRNERRDGES